MPDVLKSIAVSLAASSLMAGATTQATATPSVEVTPDGLLDDNFQLVWSSSNPAIATVSATGLVRAVAAGTAQIRATSGTIVGTANLTVQALPVVNIDAAGYSLINGLAIGASFELRGPVGTGSFLSQKQP